MSATFAPRYPHALAQATAPSPARRAASLLLVLGLTFVALVGLQPTRAEAATPRAVQLRIAASSTSISYGGGVALWVRLLSESGTPISGRTVSIDVLGGGVWTSIGTVRTDSGGRGHLGRNLRTTKTFRARHTGDATWAGKISTGLTVRVGTLGASALREATRHYGKPYQWGASGPSRFDCSGFTSYVFARFGKYLPHQSGQQAGVTRRIDPSLRRVGDLIFTWTSGRISHVGIYAGNNEMWAATKSGDIVRKQALFSRSITVGRVV